jgi:hypothetical protein
MIKFQKELDCFASKAKAFCDWVEGDFKDPLEELLKAEQLLTELHSSILGLSNADAVWEDVEDLTETEEYSDADKAAWHASREKFTALPIDGYWEIFDASNIEDDSPVFATVSDDLSDIYSDLKGGLILYEKEMFAEAFWEWRFNFEIHWGNHLVGCQKAIRNYFAYKGDS